jgi:hypothetical protein
MEKNVISEKKKKNFDQLNFSFPQILDKPRIAKNFLNLVNGVLTKILPSSIIINAATFKVLSLRNKTKTLAIRFLLALSCHSQGKKAG